jgi:hypothetical protein
MKSQESQGDFTVSFDEDDEDLPMPFDDEDPIPPSTVSSKAERTICKCSTLACLATGALIVIIWLSYGFRMILELMGFDSEIFFYIITLFVGIGLGYAWRSE